jgi:hypothetical protein
MENFDGNFIAYDTYKKRFGGGSETPGMSKVFPGTLRPTSIPTIYLAARRCKMF